MYFALWSHTGDVLAIGLCGIGPGALTRLRVYGDANGRAADRTELLPIMYSTSLSWSQAREP